VVVVGQDLQLGGEVDLAHDDVVGDRDEAGCEVQDRSHAGGDQTIGDLLGGCGRGGDDADGHERFATGAEFVEMGHRDPGELAADLGRVDVVERDDREPALAEPAMAGEGPAQVAEPDDGDAGGRRETEASGDLEPEIPDVVADPAGAVGTEIRQVLADLRCVEAGQIGELVRRDGRDVGVVEIAEHTEVHRQAADGRIGDPALGAHPVLVAVVAGSGQPTMAGPAVSPCLIVRRP
jgi:hypothetical protein